MMINYMGGIAGGLLAFLLGAIWYAPGVFGHIWARHCGLSEAQIKSASPRKMFLLALPLSLLAGLVFAAFLGDAGLGLSIGAGLAAGVCWVSASLGINYIYEQKPLGLFLVNAGYHSMQFLLYGLSVGVANQFF